MTVIEGRTWLEILQPDERRRLLADQERAARGPRRRPGDLPRQPHRGFGHDRVPDRPGQAPSLARSPIVCFEVDGVEPVDRRGWSAARAGGDTDRLTGLDLRHWAPGEKQYWIRIEPLGVSGRRIYRPQADR